MKYFYRIQIISFMLLLAVFYVQTPASNISPEAPLEAQWLPNAVKISFDSNDGGTPPGDQIYTYGIERSLPGVSNMLKSGYHVIGWAETADAETPKWPLGAVSAEAFGYADATKAVAKTLYAVWEKEVPDSHIGQIIMSTTLDTEEKVKELYGGTSWTKITNRFLVGAGGSYSVNSTGGEASHTLTANEMPSHNHTFTASSSGTGTTYKGVMTTTKKTNVYPNYTKPNQFEYYNGGGGPQYSDLTLVDITTGGGSVSGTIGYTGGGVAHNNMPPYKAVYIWERTL